MARIYADNVVFLMRPGEATRRHAGHAPDQRIPPSGAVTRRVPVAAVAGASPGYSHTVAPRPAASHEARQQAGAGARRAPLRWVLLLATACVLPVAVGTWRAVVHQASLQHYATATGEQRKLALPGGGTALLDTGTAISMGAGQRHALELRRGRAQFDLAPASTQTFAVHAGGGIVSATGGRFQVSRLAHAVRVVALAGTVSVNLPASSEQLTLRPGEQVDYGYGRLGGAQPADLAAARGWPRGELVFHHRSLAELVAAMNRYSDTRLVIGDAAMRNLPVNGVFDAGDPAGLAQALQRSRLLRAVRVSPYEIVLQPAAR